MPKSSFKAREAVKRLCADKGGVVSFEYVIVGACIVGTVTAVFGGTGAGTIPGGLAAGFTAITMAITTAV